MKRIAVALGCAVLLCGCSEKKSEIPESEQDKPNITTTIETTQKIYDKLTVNGLSVIVEENDIRVTKNGTEVQTLTPALFGSTYGSYNIDVQDIDMDGNDDIFIRDSLNSDLNEGVYYIYDKSKDRFIATTQHRRLVPAEECGFLKGLGLEGMFVDDRTYTLDIFKREGPEFVFCGRYLRRDGNIVQLYKQGGYEYTGEVPKEYVQEGLECKLDNSSLVISNMYGYELQTIKGDFSVGGTVCVKDFDFDSYDDIFVDTMDGHALYFHYDPAEQKYVDWEELNQYDIVFRIDYSDKTLYSGGYNQTMNSALGAMSKYRWNGGKLKYVENRILMQDFPSGKYKVECYDPDGKLFRTDTFDELPEIWRS